MERTGLGTQQQLERADIGGWFDFSGTYDYAFDRLKDGDWFAEIGCWLGKSIHYMASKAVEQGKKINIVAVDLWPPEYDGLRPEGGSYETFLKHVRQFDHILPVRMHSPAAANLFPDEYFSAVFIDGDHTYQGAKSDCESWLPKVKHGGLLFGHDFADAFPGVEQAVRELFGGNFERRDFSCWLYAGHRIQTYTSIQVLNCSISRYVWFL